MISPRPFGFHHEASRVVTLCFAVLLVSCNGANVSTHSEPDVHQAPGDESEASSSLESPRPFSDRVTDADDISQPLAVITGLSNDRYNGSLQSELVRVDPKHDGWDTESFSELATEQLKRLAKFVAHPHKSDQQELTDLVDPRFVCGPLRPEPLSQVFDDKQFTVHRRHAAEFAAHETSASRGPESFRMAVEALRSSLNIGAKTEVRVHFKLFRVDKSESLVTTTAYFELFAQDASRSIQQTAKWSCQWNTENGTGPRLLSIQVLDFEETQSRAPLFTDCTESVLSNNLSYAEHIVHGFEHWRESLDWRFGMEVAAPHGLTIGDVNGDGLDDVYMCETGGLPNRLFLQQPDGTARDASAAWQLDYLEPCHSALLIDLDNDSDQDMVLASSRYILLLENTGDRFQQRHIHSTMSIARSLAAADYDLDGDLDIYVCGYFPREAAADGVGLGRPMPYHDANNGVPNYLLDNRGKFEFHDVTKTVGLDANNRRFSYAAAWEDYDNDGDPDLYVANDFGRNNLYRNDNGRFVDVAATAGVEDISAGMSVSWSDYNRDGLMDVYIGNMFSSAGNRITYQRRFKDGLVDSTRAHYQRHARGNSLFQNMGDGTFRDVSESAAVTMGRWSWSSNFADINNDGWDDLLVANGMVTAKDDPGDL